MDFKKRISRLQQKTDLLISDPADIFYYTGYQPGIDDHPLLLVKKAKKPILFVSPLSGKIAAFAEVRELTSASDLLSQLGKNVGIDENHLPSRIFLSIKKKSVPFAAGDLIKKPREVKDHEEIELIKEAIALSKKTIQKVSIFYKSERGIAQEIEREFYKNNASPAFETIVASGKNAGKYIHHFPTGKKTSPKEMIIVDFGARVKGYSADITRTYASPDKKHQKMFEEVRNLQAECIRMVRPGIGFKTINDYYKKSLEKKGFQVRHGIGHGIGIFVHESAQQLQEGMIITIEPGIYVKNVGGCRIEDMVLVKKKSEVLSRSIPLFLQK